MTLSLMSNKMVKIDRYGLNSTLTDDGVSVVSISSSKSSLGDLDECIHKKIRRGSTYFHHRKFSRLFKTIKRFATYEHIIILINELEIDRTKWLISQLYLYRQIKCILILSTSTNFDLEYEQTINKTIDIFHDRPSLLTYMEVLLDKIREEVIDDDSFIILNRPQKALKDLRENFGSFLWTNTIRSVLIAMPYNTNEAKTEMLDASRQFFRNNTRRLAEIDRFAQEYRSCDAIRWYTKQSFLHQIINKALRSEDPFVLYSFRYYIFDLSQQLALNRSNMNNLMTLYRGATIHRDEVKKLTVGSLVAVNSFFSSSYNKNVAYAFLGISETIDQTTSKGQDDEKQFVLFEIMIDGNMSPDLVVADASIRSEIRDEEEMLFDLGSTFEIQAINYDQQKSIWIIQLTYSQRNAHLVKQYDKYIRDRLEEFNPKILFGCILITNLGEYQHAKEYFHVLLKTIDPDSQECANICYELARTYRFQGEYAMALQYFHIALELQQKYLPKSNFAYAMTLAGIATVYLERCQSKEALTVLKQADLYFKEYPFDYNYETMFQANRLSYAYYLTHDFGKALELLNVALEAYEKKMLCDHPSYAQAWHNIGLIRRAQGNYDESKKAFEEALRIRKARLSSDHPYIARTHYQMSLLYEEIGAMTLADEHATAALKIRRISLPAEHIELKESNELIEHLRHESIRSMS